MTNYDELKRKLKAANTRSIEAETRLEDARAALPGTPEEVAARISKLNDRIIELEEELAEAQKEFSMDYDEHLNVNV